MPVYCASLVRTRATGDPRNVTVNIIAHTLIMSLVCGPLCYNKLGYCGKRLWINLLFYLFNNVFTKRLKTVANYDYYLFYTQGTIKHKSKDKSKLKNNSHTHITNHSKSTYCMMVCNLFLVNICSWLSSPNISISLNIPDLTFNLDDKQVI